MTQLPQTQTLALELDEKDGWLTIWFTTPENRNAMTEAAVDDFISVLSAIRDDRTIRGITIRGKGGMFCAGGDLKTFQAGLGGGATHKDISTMNREGGVVFSLVNSAPQVVVVLIEGAAIGGGLGLAACADLCATTRDAKFSLTETQLGIVPAQIAPHVARRIGAGAARRLMLTGARFKGDKAGALGLVDEVCEDAAGLDAFEASIRAEVKSCAPGANAATKQVLAATEQLPPEELEQFAADRFADCLLSDEGREGVTAFIEKRKPRWAQ